MIKLIITSIVKFLINLGMAATAEKFISSCFFAILGSLADMTKTEEDDQKVKELEEVYLTYMEKKNNE